MDKYIHKVKEILEVFKALENKDLSLLKKVYNKKFAKEEIVLKSIYLDLYPLLIAEKAKDEFIELYNSRNGFTKDDSQLSLYLQMANFKPGSLKNINQEDQSKGFLKSFALNMTDKDIDILKFLLDQGEHPIENKFPHVPNFLWYNNHPDKCFNIMKFLIEKYNFDINELNEDGLNILLANVSFCTNKDKERFLKMTENYLSLGLEIDEKNNLKLKNILKKITYEDDVWSLIKRLNNKKNFINELNKNS